MSREADLSTEFRDARIGANTHECVTGIKELYPQKDCVLCREEFERLLRQAEASQKLLNGTRDTGALVRANARNTAFLMSKVFGWRLQ